MENSPAWHVLRYHEETKHRLDAYAAGPEAMDWSIQPAPFRTYDGVTPILLPLLNRDSAAAHADLYERLHNPAWDFELENIAAFLELSLGLSAWKQVGNSAPWALRMNP